MTDVHLFALKDVLNKIEGEMQTIVKTDAFLLFMGILGMDLTSHICLYDIVFHNVRVKILLMVYHTCAIYRNFALMLRGIVCIHIK